MVRRKCRVHSLHPGDHPCPFLHLMRYVDLLAHMPINMVSCDHVERASHWQKSLNPVRACLNLHSCLPAAAAVDAHLGAAVDAGLQPSNMRRICRKPHMGVADTTL